MMLHLTALEPFAVTAPEISRASDLPVCLDPVTKNLVMPGATVAGSLRHHTKAKLGSQFSDDWFGPDFGNSLTDSVDRSSVVRVVGALLHDETKMPLAGTKVFPRKQTAIDRRRRSAKPSSLRDSLVVPAGAKMTCFVRLDDPEHLPDSESRQRLLRPTALPQLLEVFGSWSPIIGRAKTSGQGRMRLDELKVGYLDLSDCDDRWRWITLFGTALFENVCTQSKSVKAESDSDVVTTTFRILDPLIIGGGAAKGNSRRLLRRPMSIGGTPDSYAPYAGSSMKGVLRSRCEYIVKSIRASKGDPDEDSLIDLLFGSTELRGALRFTDTPVRHHVLGTRPHVAIDRVSGGARDSALFEDEVFDDGLLTVSIGWLPLTPAPSWAKELIECALADFDDGLVGVGSATNRGHGSVKRVERANRQPLTAETIEVLRKGIPPAPQPDGGSEE